MLPRIVKLLLIFGRGSSEFPGYHRDFCLRFSFLGLPSAIQPVCWRIRTSPHGEGGLLVEPFPLAPFP